MSPFAGQGTPVPARVGIFGGAFDPPHRAHVALARTAIDSLALDLLHIVPTGEAWHKARSLSPAADRLAMCEAAFGDIARVRIDDRELRRPGPSYTLDTLRELRTLYPAADLYLLLGSDQAAALPSWNHWEDILRLAIISIAHRPDADSTQAMFDIEKWPSARVRRLPLPDMPVSATDIRARLSGGRGADHLVAPGVARYIELHHLYRTA